MAPDMQHSFMKFCYEIGYLSKSRKHKPRAVLEEIYDGYNFLGLFWKRKPKKLTKNGNAHCMNLFFGLLIYFMLFSRLRLY